MSSLTVGVLGGLGPEATADFFTKVVAATDAAIDQDHLRLLIDSNPRVPNRNEAIAGRGPSPGPELAAMARGLETAGADFLVMVCNAAHAFQPDIEAAVDVPFVSIIDVTCEAVLSAAPGVRRVAVLAAAGCVDAGLYQDAFAAVGVTADLPEGETRERFMGLLYRIKAGEVGAESRAEMKAIADALLARGGGSVVAGCTEVPLVLDAADLDVPLISSTDALVKATVAYAQGAFKAR